MFLRYGTKSISNKENINKLNIIKIKTFVHQEEEKITHRVRKTQANYMWERTLSRIYKELLQLSKDKGYEQI